MEIEEIRSIATITAYLKRIKAKKTSLAEDKAFVKALGEYIERCGKSEIKGELIDEIIECIDGLLEIHQKTIRREAKKLLIGIKADCFHLTDKLDANANLTTKDYKTALSFGQQFIDAAPGLGVSAALIFHAFQPILYHRE